MSNILADRVCQERRRFAYHFGPSGRMTDGELIFVSERHAGQPTPFIDRLNPIDPGFSGILGAQLFLTCSRHVRYVIGRLEHFLNGRCEFRGRVR